MSEVGEVARPAQRVEEPAPVAAGPLLAVCGLAGGAGASTLAYLVARSAAGSDAEPVLVCDTGGPTAGLSTYAGAASPRSLTGAADAIAAGEALEEGLFTPAAPGLRVLARGPELESSGETAAMGRLLADAREIHKLTVVDCGTLARPSDREVLAMATHIIWTLPATISGRHRGERFLELVPVMPDRRELVVARRDDGARRAPLVELKALAEARRAPLVLMPHVPDLAEGGLERALDEASVTLAAIGLELRK